MMCVADNNRAAIPGSSLSVSHIAARWTQVERACRRRVDHTRPFQELPDPSATDYTWHPCQAKLPGTSHAKAQRGQWGLCWRLGERARLFRSSRESRISNFLTAFSPMTSRSVRFEVVGECPHTRARAGLLHTPHGTIETPVFMPVGTQSAVMALTQQMLEELGAQIILGNTYHLLIRPGHELVAEMGGLHRF